MEARSWEKEGAVWDREQNTKHTLGCLHFKSLAPETLHPPLRGNAFAAIQAPHWSSCQLRSKAVPELLGCLVLGAAGAESCVSACHLPAGRGPVQAAETSLGPGTVTADMVAGEMVCSLSLLTAGPSTAL